MLQKTPDQELPGDDNPIVFELKVENLPANINNKEVIKNGDAQNTLNHDANKISSENKISESPAQSNSILKGFIRSSNDDISNSTSNDRSKSTSGRSKYSLRFLNRLSRQNRGNNFSVNGKPCDREKDSGRQDGVAVIRFEKIDPNFDVNNNSNVDENVDKYAEVVDKQKENGKTQ